MKIYYLSFLLWSMALIPINGLAGSKDKDAAAFLDDDQDDEENDDQGASATQEPAEKNSDKTLSRESSGELDPGRFMMHEAAEGVFRAAASRKSDGEIREELRKVILEKTLEQSDRVLKSELEELYIRHQQSFDTGEVPFPDYWRDSIMNAIIYSTRSEGNGQTKIRTTLLNEFLRTTGVFQHAEKVLTLFEYGASKNLANGFLPAPPMYSQREYPLQIVLFELWDKCTKLEEPDAGLLSRVKIVGKRKNPLDYIPKKIVISDQSAFDTRATILDHLLNDQVMYLKSGPPQKTTAAEKERDEKLKTITDTRKNESENNTLEVTFWQKRENINYPVTQLFQINDHISFKKLVRYLERKNIFLMEPRTEDQLNEEFYSPILEEILELMYDIRAAAKILDDSDPESDNEEGEIDAVFNGANHYKDFISIFFSQSNLKRHFKSKIGILHEEQFDADFQRHLSGSDFEAEFNEVQGKIKNTKKNSNTNIQEEDVKPLIMRYAQVANFRTRLDVHCNRFGMTLGNLDGTVNFMSKGDADDNAVFKNSGASSDEDGNEKPGKAVGKAFFNALRLRRFAQPSIPYFEDLRMFNGTNMIFAGINNRGWSPVMYTVAQRDSNGLKLIISQDTFEYTPFTADVTKANLFHIALGMDEEGIKKLSDTSEDERANALAQMGPKLDDKDYYEKTLQTVNILLNPDNKKGADKERTIRKICTALTSKSNLGFTPIAQAAATGQVESLNKMQAFLREHDGGVKDADHKYFDTNLFELEAIALANVKTDEDEDGDGLDPRMEEIKRRKKELASKIKKSKQAYLLGYFDETNDRAREIEEQIHAAAMEKYESFKSKDATDNSADNPLKDALLAALQVIKEGELEETEEEREVVLKSKDIKAAAAAEKQKKSGGGGLFGGLFGGGKSSNKSGDGVPVAPVKKKEKFKVPNPLYPLFVATPEIKKTYYLRTIKDLLSEYVKKFEPEKGSVTEWTDIYLALTGSSAQTFFEPYGGQEFERVMGEMIRQELGPTGLGLLVDDKKKRPVGKKPGKSLNLDVKITSASNKDVKINLPPKKDKPKE